MATFNPDALLNLEKRTGVKDSDIDDFVSKADEVQRAIKGLMDGSLSPQDVKIAGLESDEEKQEKESRRQAALAAQRVKAEELRIKRKEEERERWWDGAELFVSAGGASDCDDDGTTTALAADPKKAIAQRYALDYSRWQEWTPDDPATLQEREEVERAENDKKNAEFERNNPDFCNQYKEDIENRTKAVKKKAETAESARLKGNNLFKKKMLEEALNMYIESLKLLPYDVKTLTNIAQVHIQRKEWDDALEFLKRSLHMDKNLVKALSRKAFVLGETGQPRDALAALARALELEPRNEDLLLQKRELDVVVMELTAEERLAESLSAEEAGVEAMDALCAALEAITPSVAAGGEAAAAGCIVDEAIVSRALRAEKGSESVRIYVRTSGCLQATLTYLSAVGDACTDPALLDRLETLLLLLADAVDKQRAPKMLMIERKALKTIKTFLGYPSSHAGLMNGCLRLLDRTSCDDTCAKARDLVLTDRELLTRISIVVGELSAAEGDASRDASRDDAIFMSGASVLRYAAFADSAKTVLTAGVGIGVCAIAAVIEKSADSTSQPSESFCMAVEALLGLSQAAPLRPFFAAPLPRREAQQKDVSAAVTATSVVIRVGRIRPALLATCLAVLMNASLENEPVRSEILLHGGLADTLAVLKYTDKQRADCHDDYILSRSAGVLSRIATAPEAQQQLLQQDTYSLVCRCLKRACAKAEPRQRWEDDETGHLVRLLASITPDKPCRDAGVAEGVLTSILSIFPEPRRELHEITPTTVTLVPERIAGTVILGNAARCLMPYADDTDHAAAIYAPRSSLSGPEKMVCAMATCSDIRVRKNIAILLAKGCRIQGVRERLQELRGMQMLVELQSQL